MARQHLTDEDIQNILDGNSPQQGDLEHHLETCKICQNHLRQYQSLYVGLKEEPEFKLPRSFAKSIISKLTTQKTALFASPEIIFVVLGVLLGLGTTLYLVDMKPVVEIVRRITFSRTAFETAVFDPMKNLLSNLNTNLSLLLSAGLVMFTVAAIDRIILKLKHHKISL